ncbi:MAG: hypothetical protein ACR2IA_04305, partial [Pyrinomonadaceae bacterium]
DKVGKDKLKILAGREGRLCPRFFDYFHFYKKALWLNITFDERKNADFIDLAADAECRRATTVLFYYFNERLSNHLLNLAAVRFLHQIARSLAIKIKRGNLINYEKRMKKTITKSRRKIYN